MLTRSMLADGYHLHEPATQSAIDRCEQEAGYGFPEDYIALLLISDGLRTDGKACACGQYGPEGSNEDR